MKDFIRRRFENSDLRRLGLGIYQAMSDRLQNLPELGRRIVRGARRAVWFQKPPSGRFRAERFAAVLPMQKAPDANRNLRQKRTGEIIKGESFRQYAQL